MTTPAHQPGAPAPDSPPADLQSPGTGTWSPAPDSPPAEGGPETTPAHQPGAPAPDSPPAEGGPETTPDLSGDIDALQAQLDTVTAERDALAFDAAFTTAVSQAGIPAPAAEVARDLLSGYAADTIAPTLDLLVKFHTACMVPAVATRAAQKAAAVSAITDANQAAPSSRPSWSQALAPGRLN